MRKKIGIFIDHDIIVRHFIKSNIFCNLEKEYDLYFFFPENHKRVKIKVEDLNIKNYFKIPINEKRSYKIRMFYHACNVRNLKKKINKNEEEVRYKQILGKKLFYFYKYVLMIDFFFKIFKFFKQIQIKNNFFISKILKEKKIDLVIHPTVLEGLFVYDLINIGKNLGISTFYLMNSWDNPSTKALMGDPPDKLFVWGEQTKNHAIEYLRIPEKNIVISGAAQMQTYKSNLTEKNKYRSLIKVSSEIKLICYAGSSRGLNETKQLLIIDDYLQKNKLKNIKVLYKPHPWKDFSNEDEINFYNYNFKNIIMDPYSEKNYRLRSLKSEKINIELINYDYTSEILRSVDALYTPLSTIMLEASMQGIPVCTYCPNQKNEFQMGFNHDLGRIMFQEFFDKIKPIIITSDSKIENGINELITIIDNNELKEKLKSNSIYFNETMVLDYKQILDQNVKKALQ